MIREEVSEQLDYRPASMIVIQDITEVYGGDRVRYARICVLHLWCLPVDGL